MHAAIEPSAGRASTYWQVFDALDLCWLWDAIVDAAAQRSLADAGARRRSATTCWRRWPTSPTTCSTPGRSTRGCRPTSGWSTRDALMFTEIRRADHHDLTTLVGRPPPAAQPLADVQPRALSRSVRRRTRPDRPSPLALRRHERTTVPHRALADGLLPRRRCADGALQLGARPAARRHVRAAHRGHRRGAQPAGVDRRASSTRSRGSASTQTTRCSRARTSRARTPTQHVAAAQPPVRGRARLLLRPDAGADPGAVEGERQAGLRRVVARPRPRPGSRVACCGSACPTGTTVVHDAVRGEVTFDNASDRGLRAAARQRHADVPARQRRRRHRDADHARDPRRGAPAEHAEAADAVGGARARRRRCGRTCRWWSTSSARSCRSVATRWRSRATATRATSPRRW